MAHPRQFRFGLQVSAAESGAAWRDLARKAEDQGFATLFMPDHFEDQLAPMPALAAAAEATTDLRIGVLVADNDYRHPVVHAKELATLDILSDGRVEAGIGAGWMRTDYEKSGITYDPPGTRIDRFVEGLAVIKGLFADGAFSFDGRHYSITGLDGLPKPVQRPHPPVLIGAGGPRMLRIAAREADIVGVNPSLRSGAVDTTTTADATAAAYDDKLAVLREAAGTRFDDLELSCLLFFVTATDDRLAFATNIAPAFGLTPEDALEVPLALAGSVDEMCDQLEARRERWGISYVVCQSGAADTLAPVVARLAGT
ncbi:MAG: TIGR03621 family F420-dependent LLM class oxidoreductase [Acidimicrobiia bacterium]|nr:TIGR03621 family F420-dependent LLM class oxidoreductase [Acidimicrobiia bacterium]